MTATRRASIFRGNPLRAVLPAVLVSLVSIAAAAPARADCTEAAEALKAAIAARDLYAIRDRLDAVRREVACSDAFRMRAGLAASMAHARVAQERVASGASLASQRAMLERALGYGRAWPVLALLGDAAHDEKDYGRATERYEEALAVIDDEVRTPRPPPPPEIARIFRRAAQSRMLAPEYRPSPRTRSGAPAGLAAGNIRGFEVESVPVPITFHTDSAELTEDGRRAAADMVDYLTAQRVGRIAIAGHTDPRGTEAYNLALSRHRAEAVADYLYRHGFPGAIQVIARGESEPFSIDDPDAYTREQRWQMDRRVELIR